VYAHVRRRLRTNHFPLYSVGAPARVHVLMFMHALPQSDATWLFMHEHQHMYTGWCTHRIQLLVRNLRLTCRSACSKCLVLPLTSAFDFQRSSSHTHLTSGTHWQ
jgi:hypothetical protein